MSEAAQTWATPLLAAFRSRRLDAAELWCLVLDCHVLADPAPVVAHVLRATAAFDSAAVPSAPACAPTPAPSVPAPVRSAAIDADQELLVLEDVDAA